jgi:hypothetical protein
MFLWALFLLRMSRLDLALIPLHPDMAAGIGFLSQGQLKFAPIIFAGGIVMAGQIANAIAYEGATLDGMKYVIVGYCAFAMALLLAPLLLFMPVLARVRKQGLLDYGVLAASYTHMFDAKWFRGTPPEDESLLGTSDIQSLADLSNSLAIVRAVRLAPIDKRTLIGLASAAALPMLPVLILGTSVDTVFKTIFKLLA